MINDKLQQLCGSGSLNSSESDGNWDEWDEQGIGVNRKFHDDTSDDTSMDGDNGQKKKNKL
jgi:hypothetical protein